MKIRQARLTDLDDIVRIERENFSPAEAISEDILKAHIETIQSTFLVAEMNQQIVGYLEGPVRSERYLVDSSFTADLQEEAHLPDAYISLTSLSISKAAQGMGVGQSLLTAMKELAIRDERRGINLTCHDYLIAYYEKHGFVNEGVSKSTYAGELWYDLVWENPHKL